MLENFTNVLRSKKLVMGKEKLAIIFTVVGSSNANR